MKPIKHETLVSILVIVVVAMSFLPGSAQQDRHADAKWEYNVIELGHPHSESDKEWTAKLNGHADHGWEVTQLVLTPNGSTMHAVLKRLKK